MRPRAGRDVSEGWRPLRGGAPAPPEHDCLGGTCPVVCLKSPRKPVSRPELDHKATRIHTGMAPAGLEFPEVPGTWIASSLCIDRPLERTPCAPASLDTEGRLG